MPLSDAFITIRLILLDVYVVLRTSPAFSVFTSSIIVRGGRSLGSHPSLTEAMVPPKFHLRILLHARPSFRQLQWGRGLGSVRSFSGNEDFVDYTAGTSLSGRRLLLAFAFTRLNFDKE